MKTEDKFCIVGAGFSGLGVAAAMTRAEIPFDVIEADDDVGGNWYHGVYDTAHIISSKKTTQYSDHPMPDDYPDFPSAAQMLAYLRAYADRWGIRERTQFRSSVENVRPLAGDRWQVTLQSGEARESRETRIYRGVVICNGHHWDKRMPQYPGTFDGTLIHSKDYKSPEVLAGKRVLVIGGGNSACDVAVEAARFAESSHISLRRGYWFLPKTFFGIPTVEYMRPFFPLWAQRLFLKTIVRLVFGPYTRYGLPEPDHKIFERHPTLNSQLLYFIKHGRIRPEPDIARYDGKVVEFTDGRRAEFDLIVAATGFNVSLPMLEPGLIEWKDGYPQLIEGIFPPNHKNLYVFGLGQPRYGAGPLITAGAELLCRIIETQPKLQHPIGRLLARMGRTPPKTWLKDPIKLLRGIETSKKLVPRLPRLEPLLVR
jgi:uncharacterized NAD(P)/FAD-binding protein YdhS